MATQANIMQETKRKFTQEQFEKYKQNFYSAELPTNIDDIRKILQEYSSIPAENVEEHVLKIRDQGWKIRPYPCIGQFRFLELQNTISSPYYQNALAQLRTDDPSTALLDVACCVGQALRALAFDGVDAAKLYGTDVEQGYIDLGFDLFLDRDRLLPSHLVAADMLAEPRDPRLDQFVGKMTHIHVSSFFHLFKRPQQIAAAQRCVEFLRTDRSDTMIFGGMLGRESSGDVAMPGGVGVFMHNDESWRKMWDEVGDATGTKWGTSFEIVEGTSFAADVPGFEKAQIQRARFVVKQKS